MVKFGIESKHSCTLTSTAAFKEGIIAAMRDMKLVCMLGLSAADAGGTDHAKPVDAEYIAMPRL